MIERSHRATLQCAYVLHHRPYGESSQLLEVLTRDYGRIGLITRGSRRRQRGGNILQPFVPLLLSWTGRGELWTLTHAECRGGITPISGIILLSGFYVNELLVRMLQRQDPHPSLYDHYETLLSALATLTDRHDDRTRLQVQLRIFEKLLLESLGYGLVFDKTVDDTAVVADGAYRYDAGCGFSAVTKTTDASSDRVFTGASLLGLAKGAFADDHALAGAKRLMRLLIEQQLGDKPLQSRRLLVQWQQHAANGSTQHHRNAQHQSPKE